MVNNKIRRLHPITVVIQSHRQPFRWWGTQWISTSQRSSASGYPVWFSLFQIIVKAASYSTFSMLYFLSYYLCCRVILKGKTFKSKSIDETPRLSLTFSNFASTVSGWFFPSNLQSNYRCGSPPRDGQSQSRDLNKMVNSLASASSYSEKGQCLSTR